MAVDLVQLRDGFASLTVGMRLMLELQNPADLSHPQQLPER